MLQQFGLVLAASALVGSACLLNSNLEESPSLYPHELMHLSVKSLPVKWVDIKQSQVTAFQGSVIEFRELRNDDRCIHVGKNPLYFVRIRMSKYQPLDSPFLTPDEEVSFAVEVDSGYSMYLNKTVSLVYLYSNGELKHLMPCGC